MNYERVPVIWLAVCGTIYVIGLALSLALSPWPFLVGYGLGGALVVVNSALSARRVKAAGFPHKNRALTSLLGGFYVRLVVLGVCLYGLIRYLHVDPIGLVAGLSVIPAGLFVMLVLIYLANRRPEEA